MAALPLLAVAIHPLLDLIAAMGAYQGAGRFGGRRLELAYQRIAGLLVTRKDKFDDAVDIWFGRAAALTGKLEELLPQDGGGIVLPRNVEGAHEADVAHEDIRFPTNHADADSRRKAVA